MALSWDDMGADDAWVAALRPQGFNAMSGAWAVALALHVCQTVDVYGMMTAENAAVSVGVRYHCARAVHMPI